MLSTHATVGALMQDLWLIILLLVNNVVHVYLHHDEVHGYNHCSVHCMYLNIKYVSGNSADNEPNSKQTSSKSSV